MLIRPMGWQLKTIRAPRNIQHTSSIGKVNMNVAKLRGALIAGAVVVVFGTTAYAVAESSETDAQPVPVGPASLPEEEATFREAAANEEVSGSETNRIPDVKLPNSLIENCETVLKESPQDTACLAVVAQASGELRPGTYTDEELDAALADKSGSAR